MEINDITGSLMGAVLILILLTSGVIALEDITFESKPMLVDMEFYLDKILTVLFLIEIYIKLFSMGFVSYFSNAWCWLDFIIGGMLFFNFSAALYFRCRYQLIFPIKIVEKILSTWFLKSLLILILFQMSSMTNLSLILKMSYNPII